MAPSFFFFCSVTAEFRNQNEFNKLQKIPANFSQILKEVSLKVSSSSEKVERPNEKRRPSSGNNNYLEKLNSKRERTHLG